jgi:biopolymer transport protein TolR
MRIAEINITPLIDVMLVLLILFMVITPSAPHSLDAAVPKPPMGSVPSVVLLLTVDARGYALNRAPLSSLDEVGARLSEAFLAGAPRTVLVEVVGEPSYGRVVEALDTAQGAGAQRLGLR